MKNEKKITRRKFIKDSAIAAAGVSALAVGTTSGLSLLTREAWAQSNLRAEILKSPGLGWVPQQTRTGRKSGQCAWAPPRKM